MSTDYGPSQRCPRCGNENRGDSYSCTFCGKRLRIERIEGNYLFRRLEEEWIQPLPWYRKILYLFSDPSRAFWDINHRRKEAPGWYILLFNCLLYGLIGLAFLSKFQLSIGGDPLAVQLFMYYFVFFLAFFVFGFVFQFLFFIFLTWLYGKGANLAVDFSERLETRFGEEEKEKYEEYEMSPFSIYKGGTLLQGQQAYKFKMLLSAYVPFVLLNAVKILLIFILTPTTSIDLTSGSGVLTLELFNSIISSPVILAMDVLDTIALIWSSVLVAIAIRELSNSSTFRVLISSLIIGTAFAIFFFFIL